MIQVVNLLGGGDLYITTLWEDLELTIKLSLHKTHRRYTDGKEIIEVEGKTVGECLTELVRKYPPLEKEIV